MKKIVFLMATIIPVLLFSQSKITVKTGGSGVSTSDTAAMLANRTKNSDTSYMVNNLLRKTDTSAMLGNLLRKTDTAQMKANLLKKSDTAQMLSGYLRTGNAAAGGNSPLQELTTKNITSVTAGANLSITGNITAGGITVTGGIEALNLAGTVYSGLFTGVDNIVSVYGITSYQRVGNIVTVGFYAGGSTSNTANASFLISIPVGAQFDGSSGRAYGSAAANFSGLCINICEIYSSTYSKSVRVGFFPCMGGGFNIRGSFQYQVL